MFKFRLQLVARTIVAVGILYSCQEYVDGQDNSSSHDLVQFVLRESGQQYLDVVHDRSKRLT